MPVLVPFLFTLALSVPAPSLPVAKLAVQRTLPVGGEGAWDYVTLDSQARRLYVPRSTRVLVLDLDGKTVGEIPATAGVHGVALAPKLDRGFSSNGRANTMTVFKLSTLEVIKEVKTTGANPDGILFDAASNQVFTFNGRGQNTTVFDATTLEVKGTIALGGKPEFPASDGQGKVFVNVEDTHELVVLDARKLTLLSRWSLAPLEDPSGLALDVAHKRLFSVGSNKLMAVVDASTGKLLQTLAIGEGCDGVAYDPGTGCAYAANGEGTVTVVGNDGHDHFSVLATVPTRKGARTLAVDEQTHRLFLPTAAFGPVPAGKPGEHPRAPMLAGSFQIVVVGENN